jgi:uncharacterized protein (DUF433 family)
LIEGDHGMIAPVLDKHIEITPGVAGGEARIAGHRITVRNIVVWHVHLGKSLDEICWEYDLTLADVHAALAYYFDHRETIDRAIEEGRALAAALRQQTPSLLEMKLGARRDG